MSAPFSRNWLVGVFAGAFVGLLVAPLFSPFRDAFNFLAWPGCAAINELDSLRHGISQREAEDQFEEASNRLDRINGMVRRMERQEDEVRADLREFAAEMYRHADICEMGEYIKGSEESCLSEKFYRGLHADRLEDLDPAEDKVMKARETRDAEEPNLELEIESTRDRLVAFNQLPEACFNGGGFSRSQRANLD